MAAVQLPGSLVLPGLSVITYAVDTTNVAVGTTPARVVGANPTRFGLLLSNLGAEAIQVSIGDNTAAPVAFLIPVASSPVVLTLYTMPGVVSRTLYATTASDTSTLGVTTIAPSGG